MCWCCFQVYLTVLKHGDSATLDTMLKVRLQLKCSTVTSPGITFIWLTSTIIILKEHQMNWLFILSHFLVLSWLCCLSFSSLFTSLCSLAPQTSRHAGGEEPHRASARRHFCPRPHPESPQLRPLGTHDHVHPTLLSSAGLLCFGGKSDPLSLVFVYFFGPYLSLLLFLMITVDCGV